MLEQADLILLVLDATQGLTAEDRALSQLLPEKTERVGLLNKVDLAATAAMSEVSGLLGAPVMGVSAHTGAGIDELEQFIARAAGLVDKEESVVANARQEEALRRAERHLEAALETYHGGLGSDLISIDIRAAWVVLGEITGESVGEDLLDQIFSRFCIGK